MAKAIVNIPREESTQEMVDRLVSAAAKASEQFMNFTQDQVDAIVKAMALAGIDKHIELAKMAVEETGMGVYEDKITKNLFATEYIYHDIKDIRTVGIIENEPEEGYMKVADPVGIIAGITPVTNPTSTTMFKCLIAMKTRNPIVFSFHPKSQNCSSAAAKTMLDAAIAAGAPAGCISWIGKPSVEATNLLMKHPGISIILATGGGAMVNAAYSSGKPALGVGPGNVPCYIDRTAKIERAVADLVLSKTFDNGTICASEQAVIIDKAVEKEVKSALKALGCYFLTPDEIGKVENLAIDGTRCAMSPAVVGQSAARIAELAEIQVPVDTKILIAELDGVGPEYPLSREKLSPILACFTVEDYKEGIRRATEMTEFGGLGHSAVIHCEDEEIIKEYSTKVRASRLIVNSPSSHGAIGDLYNSNTPSLTLGCGTMGGNATTDNVSVANLLNVKRVAIRQDRMQWFKVPPKIYFEPGSLHYLRKVKGNKCFIVTDKFMMNLGFVDKVTSHLEKANIKWEIFADVEPDPSVETVLAGVKAMNSFSPDLVIALGGGSAIDAAKGMWLFYEQPGTQFERLKLKFADIRKRAFKYPALGKKATFVAIPTTSGTGSEVTAFAVITDKKKGIKYPLADYELTPDIAIIDPDLVMTVPKSVTADTGMDVLTHAIESYVSVMASDYTDALAEKAIKLVFEYLERAYTDGSDKEAREHMHNASCIAGMAFTNAFLGLNHSMAHILGAKFHIPHGRANAVLLPYVIRYNGARPTKLAAFPQYESPKAAERYAEIARFLGLKFDKTEEGIEKLTTAITELMKKLEMPTTIQGAGINRNEFEQVITEMSDIAFNDQCTGANPRMPLVSEIAALYRKAFAGSENELQ